MTAHKWLIIDPDRGIDQEQWLVDRTKKDIAENLSKINTYARGIASEFDAAFPRDIPEKIYAGHGRRKKFIRFETPEEAQTRCVNRGKVR